MGAESNPRCKACHSKNRSTFSGEVAAHFPGLAGVDKPIVWIFPRISVCLDCGLAEFVILERELEVLRTETPGRGRHGWA